MAAKPKPAPKPLPPKPWVNRVKSDKGPPTLEITDAGLEAVRMMAASSAGQCLIASRLGVSFRGYKDLMERDERVRLAWEAGFAEEEAALVENLRRDADGGYSAASMFLLKTRHNYSENYQAADSKPNVVIVLPDARTPEEYLRMIGPPTPAAPLPEVEIVEPRRSIIR